jgi:uncharacterized protein YjbI with pentapeptide repeats
MDSEVELRTHIAAHSCAHGLSLKSVALAESDLETLIADRVDLSSANLRGASLRNSRLTRCRFDTTYCGNSDWTSATLHMCSFDNSHFESACFDGASLEDSLAIAADFSRATFRSAHLSETSFSRTVLRETILDDAEGDGIDFRGADLHSASLKGVRFDEADFRGADLRNADLSHGRFHSADFRGAILDGANFDQADCSGATFNRGESPIRPTSPASPVREVDAAALKTLNDFLALLPAALSGTRNELVMSRLQELIDHAASSSGYSHEHQQAIHDYFSDITKLGEPAIARLQQMIDTLNSNSNEPPEEWKVWLEPLMKNLQEKPSPEK